MIVNVIHRPANGKLYEMFRLQQKFAHDLGLKVTLLIPYDFFFKPDVMADIMSDHETYGDELGIWMGELTGGKMQETVPCKEPFLWLHTRESKEKILKTVLDKFREIVGAEPVCFGGYHMDAVSLELLHKMCPSIRISIAGCFEEGVKVFHGCNNSWYLFNEGMPWHPWYPAKENSLRPASNESEWCGIVAVPHLCRDMALSYEGRNDFFASHPANIQRAMANEGAIAPYTLNLLDIYRYQERFNDGFSYTNVFVGPNWLSGSPNVQDSDEVTQGMYREYLEYYAQLRDEGKLQSMYMSEFADWYKENMPIGKPHLYDAKEILYGSGKDYFWYCDSKMRLLFDLFQGGSIGDLRPFVAKQPRCTGADTPHKAIGTNPYLIHSQYRTGNAHHFEDGARTTLQVKVGEEMLDLADCPVRLVKASREENGVYLELSDIALKFANVTATLKTTIIIRENAAVELIRKIENSSDPNALFQLTEYCKGCWGTTEYPEEMGGIELAVPGESIVYGYEGRILRSQAAGAATAAIPALETVLGLEGIRGNFVSCEAEEGYLFNPYYTLRQTAQVKSGEEMRTVLWLRKK